MKTMTLGQFLTRDEIDQCWKLWRTLEGTGRFASTVAKDIIEPNLARINAALGQENDARYLAYGVEYVFMQQTGRKR